MTFCDVVNRDRKKVSSFLVLVLVEGIPGQEMERKSKPPSLPASVMALESLLHHCSKLLDQGNQLQEGFLKVDKFHF